MNKFGLLLGGLLLSVPVTTFGQGAKNIVINEVLTNNTTNILDEFGNREAWIELANTSFTTYNVRGMYITTDRSVLDPKMSVPERIKRMSVIPNGEVRTNIGARQHLLLFCNSKPNEGKLHLSVKVDMSQPVWIALYNGNAVELIDSVTVPALNADQSYARTGKTWKVMAADNVTPGIENFIQANESKVDKFKREDPYGFAMAFMAMGIVFFCLALLWIFFTLFGMFMRHQETAKKVANTQPIKPITKTVEKTIEVGHKTGVVLQDGLKSKGIDREVYMAVIGLALRQYEDNIHDMESGVITIREKHSGWDEYQQMTQFHDPVVPTSHTAPTIPTTPEIR